MKAIEQYFPVVLFIMLYKVVLTFASVGEILKCDRSNEGYWAVRPCGTAYCDHCKRRLYFWAGVCGCFKGESDFTVRVVLESVGETLKCDQSNESDVQMLLKCVKDDKLQKRK